MQNISLSFSDSGYVTKPPQPSSAFYGAPPFTRHPFIVILLVILGSGYKIRYACGS